LDSGNPGEDVSTPTSTRIKRSLVRGGPYTPIADVTGNSFTDTGLTNGVPVFYVASNVNDAGESPNSSEVSAVPTAIPPEPTTMKVFFQTAPTGKFSAVVEGLPAGVTIAKARITSIQDTSHTWQKGFPPGSGAAMDVVGFVLTWDKLPGDTGFNARIVGSDNSDQTVVVEVRTTPPPPPDPTIAELRARIVTLESENAVLRTANTRLEQERNALDVRLSTLKATVRAACDAADLP